MHINIYIFVIFIFYLYIIPISSLHATLHAPRDLRQTFLTIISIYNMYILYLYVYASTKETARFNIHVKAYTQTWRLNAASQCLVRFEEKCRSGREILFIPYPYFSPRLSQKHTPYHFDTFPRIAQGIEMRRLDARFVYRT